MNHDTAPFAFADVDADHSVGRFRPYFGVSEFILAASGLVAVSAFFPWVYLVGYRHGIALTLAEKYVIPTEFVCISVFLADARGVYLCI